ncbi:hypothetical protein ZWY2020_051680 [Hordeum vulgare]|nr:hypothetical protein ZWY2020_051680 [Hordeum vulgare]
MERQTSFRLGALEKLKSFRGMDNFRRSKDSPGKRGDTPLHLAARAGNVSNVQRILAEPGRELAGELAARPNQDWETALYVAADKGHTEVVREILKVSDMQTAGIKASNSFDAFHIAAKQGHLDVLKELLQAFPALAMTTNSVNATALETAAIQGHIDIVNLLLETDASLAKIARNNGKTVLHSAARMGHVEVPDVSVSHLEDNKGNRPLHVATRKGNIIIVQTLLSVEGIDVNAVNRSGETALAIAEKMNNQELVNILRDAGGVVTAKEPVHPANPAKQLKQTVSDIRHDVQSQIKQTRQTKMQVQKIKSRLEKLHIGGLNNAINSNTVVAVLIATVAFAAIFTVPGNFVEAMSQAPPGMSLGQAYVASDPAFIMFLVFDSLALFISLAVVVVQTSLIVVEQKAKRRMVFVMNKLMWLACLFISAAFIALTYVVVGRDDWWLAWCTMAIGAVIMLTTLGSMCYCIVAHRMEEKSMRKIRKASASQSRSWSMPVDSDDPEMINTEYKKMYAL